MCEHEAHTCSLVSLFSMASLDLVERAGKGERFSARVFKFKAETKCVLCGEEIEIKGQIVVEGSETRAMVTTPREFASRRN